MEGSVGRSSKKKGRETDSFPEKLGVELKNERGFEWARSSRGREAE